MTSKRITPLGGATLLKLVPGQVVAPAGLFVVGQGERVEERADAARNRERILDAARKLLGRKCISQLSMDDVADAAGVGKGTLYRRFKDRSTLCHALLDEEERRLQQAVIGGLGLPVDAGAEARLRGLFRALSTFVLANAALLSDALQHHDGRGDWYEHPTRVWRRFEVQRHMRQLPRWSTTPDLRLSAAADAIVDIFDPTHASWLRMQNMPDEEIVDAWMGVALGACGL